MTADLLLAIDNGTQSLRALVFDKHGNLLTRSRVDLPPYQSPHPGWAEQDPLVFWNALCDACQQLWREGSIQPEQIAAVSLTTQRSTMINLDAGGNPLRPAIGWPDQRRTQGLPPIGGIWGLLFRLAGATETANYLMAEAEANWIIRHQPEIWSKTHKYVLLSAFLTHRLTGKFVDSVGCQVGYQPFDFKSQWWSGKFDWKWQAVPIEREKLPDLVPPAQSLGGITPEASLATGIPAGIPLIAAASDKACEVIGSGCLESHIGCLSYGTTATINTTHERYIEVIPLIPPYPSAVPGHYSLEVQIFRGYWMVSWFKKEFGLREEMLAEQQGIPTEELFDELIKGVPPGSQGLILQPYWTPGLRNPGPEAHGAIIGFSDFHTRAHIYRSMLEGIAYALREGAERTSKRSGVPVTELRVAGGGSQSDAAMQLTADVFGLPAARPHIYDASGLGAAIDAAVGIGLHPNFKQAVAEMTRVRDTFRPDPDVHLKYNKIYREVYLKLYSQLQPLYKTLRQIDPE